MVCKTKILKELIKFDKLYQGAGNEKKYYAKLALIEFCGWVEISMDDIIFKHTKRKKIVANDFKYVEKEIVKPINSFSYGHFRTMLIKTVGFQNVIKIEDRINTRTKTLFQSRLANLKPMRDDHAHTFLKGCTRRIHSPSTIIISYFDDIYNGLVEFQKRIKGL